MTWKAIGIALALFGAAGTAGAVGNLADVTIYDRTARQALPVHRHEGRYYVAGERGHEYQVKIRNRGAGDILAVVSVDGVNAVSGETANWDQTGYVLGRHETLDLRGWRKSLDRVAAFFFTSHRNAYATRTGRPDNVGVIGVAVFRRKHEPRARIERPAPRSESPFPGDSDDFGDGSRGEAAPEAGPSGSGGRGQAGRDASMERHAPRKSASIGTGHGRRVHSPATYTTFERATAGPEEIVAIHYDTRANLVAMGVIRERVALPVPFPGPFAPDPR